MVLIIQSCFLELELSWKKIILYYNLLCLLFEQINIQLQTFNGTEISSQQQFVKNQWTN